jgi:hypothetical protein
MKNSAPIMIIGTTYDFCWVVMQGYWVRLRKFILLKLVCLTAHPSLKILILAPESVPME